MQFVIPSIRSPHTRARMTTSHDLATTSHDDDVARRIAWANKMRLALTRLDAIDARTGAIEQRFFKPKKVTFERAKDKWGERERAALLECILKYGLGEWSTMRSMCKTLERWDALTIRVKASRALGAQSLARYPKGWKATRATIEREYGKHKAIGEQTGCWKAGTLVEDDHGSVMKYMVEHGLVDVPPSA